MVTYRRNRVPDGAYFFTVTLLDRTAGLLTDRIGDLREAFRYVRRARPFAIDAIVVLPDHLHCIWRLPPRDLDYSLRWREIKARFSRCVLGGERRSSAHAHKGERGIWQRRFWEHTLRDDLDLSRHLDYIHYNPVKHGHVARVVDWPHSSFHRFVQQGLYPPDWGGGDPDDDGAAFGE